MGNDPIGEPIIPEVVLDQNGKPLHALKQPERRPGSFAIRAQLGPILGTLMIAALLVAGFTLFGVVIAILAALWIIKGLWNLFGLPSARTASRRGSYNAYFRTGK
ncbi:MAG: hypothetical protein NDJ90_13520 [Oligoflexia bacterium]|nr:hypothetical protein [Oligoflexia bacterium]